MWAKQKQSGFTIVELLIVIVVVGVLAAIITVSYRGIQTRADNSKTIQAVQGYVKIMQMYAVMYATYPVTAGYPCLSAEGSTCAKDSGAATCFGLGVTTANTSYITELRKVATGGLPTFSSQKISCNGSLFSGVYTDPSTGGSARIYYFLRGDQPCSGIGGVATFTKQQQDDLTYCRADLPTLQ